MQEADGEKIIDKYVTKTKEKPKEPGHVGGAFPKSGDPSDQYGSLNKRGIDTTRDY